MRRLLTLGAASCALAATAGCTILPTWQPPTDAKTALVALPERGRMSACVGGKAYRLERDAAGNVSLPVDSRVSLWSNYSWASGNMNYSCAPAASFVPHAGEGYTMVFEVEPENHSCSFRPYRQTTANRIGLDFEPTIGAPYACAKP